MQVYMVCTRCQYHSRLSVGVRSMQQVTRDWLLMEMSDTSLNDSMFEAIADAADLPDSCRPQVAALCQCCGHAHWSSGKCEALVV